MMDDISVLGRIAAALGAPEAGLKLLLSLLSGYPLLLFHRKTLVKSDATIQHVFFAASGLCIGYFNNGNDVAHSMICVGATWALLQAMGGTMASVIAANVFHMTYLLAGYHSTATASYDITWTMPHCVLTLRLIALVWDCYDGAKEKSALSAEQAESALAVRPSLLEMAAHTYFPASYMVGPQFCMRRYQDFVHGRLFPGVPDTVLLGFSRGLSGLCFLAVYQIGSIYLPDSYLVSDQFDDLSIWSKCLYMGLWGKVTLYKYNSCWLIVEGVLIMSGISYNARHATWDACNNIHVHLFELAIKFSDIIKSFNMNTNKWVMQYVYKRLKFLNNRNVSALAALTFLAVWHGLHSGYYMCFFLEFLVNNFEKTMEGLISRYPKLQAQLDNPLVAVVRKVLMKAYLMVFFGYCLAPFVLLSSYKWWRFFKSTYFMGHIFFGGVVVYAPAIKKALDLVYGKPAKKEAVPDLKKDAVPDLKKDAVPDLKKE